MTYDEILKEYATLSEQIVKEALAYGTERRQGEYRVEDLMNLPAELRAELIDGYVYYMEMPSYDHQMLAWELGTVLDQYVKKNQGNCIARGIPVNVQLDRDDKTLVCPDVFVLCDHSKKTKQGIVGAPDFVAEILSPSTKNIDGKVKLTKYRAAGVREYWIVDPENRTVTVCDFENNRTAIFGFDSQIPVGIFAGKCVVDFSQIHDVIKRFYASK